MPIRPVIALLSVLLLSGPRLLGQTEERGKIAGKVVDAKTGEGLPGANVTVKGTYYGATSNPLGEFRIERVGAGSYTVEVT
ncbi:carboxypeptidase-like regulatory domain-containing protein, partial [bacterium]|nr:carboxypeptidase-like regulatory domain-containing protein [bacterium]